MAAAYSPFVGASGIDSYPEQHIAPWKRGFPESAFGDSAPTTTYAGLSALEWVAAGAGVLVLCGAAYASKRQSKNATRRPGRRASRLRAWGAP